MEIEWIYYLAGMSLGLLIGFFISFFLMYGKAFFIRFILKKTPIEPVIIGIGKISVPVKAINDGRFEYENDFYIVPEGTTTPKSLITGSVSAIYLQGVPSPVTTTPRSFKFKLRDNTILCPTIRSILHNDALEKMFKTEKITHLVLFVAIIGGIMISGVVLTYVVKNTEHLQILGQVIGDQVNSLKATISSLSGVVGGGTADSNPSGPQTPLPPGGG